MWCPPWKEIRLKKVFIISFLQRWSENIRSARGKLCWERKSRHEYYVQHYARDRFHLILADMQKMQTMTRSSSGIAAFPKNRQSNKIIICIIPFVWPNSLAGCDDYFGSRMDANGHSCWFFWERARTVAYTFSTSKYLLAPLYFCVRTKQRLMLTKRKGNFMMHCVQRCTGWALAASDSGRGGTACRRRNGKRYAHERIREKMAYYI